MAAWLGSHPHIFLPKVKEPHFFNTDDKQAVTTWEAYESLFAAASEHHQAIGEASVWYLSSAVAVTNILKYQPRSRFIVMLRNPVEMAPALHAEMLLSGHENVDDFHTAWDLQEDRRQGRHLPPLTWARRRLLYGEVCSLGAQLQRLHASVPADRILTILLDDMAADPRREYLRTLRFLGVEDDGRASFRVHNRARTLRWPTLTKTLFVISQIKSRLGINLHLGVWDRVSSVNIVESPRQPLSSDTTDMLRQYFAPDVALLSTLLGRDLQHWMMPEPSPSVPAPSARRATSAQRTAHLVPY
jgi:hypothetical protein